MGFSFEIAETKEGNSTPNPLSTETYAFASFYCKKRFLNFHEVDLAFLHKIWQNRPFSKNTQFLLILFLTRTVLKTETLRFFENPANFIFKAYEHKKLRKIWPEPLAYQPHDNQQQNSNACNLKQTFRKIQNTQNLYQHFTSHIILKCIHVK